MRNPKFWIVALAIIVASACGGSSSKSSTPTSTTKAPLTKAAYLVKGNAICTTMNNRVKALGNPGKDPERAAAVIDQSSEIVRETLMKLRGLPVPAGEEGKLVALYASVDKVLVAAPAYSAALRGTSQAAADTAGQKLQAEQDAANAASIKYGLTVCGT
jgi:hypothetical protein